MASLTLKNLISMGVRIAVSRFAARAFLVQKAANNKTRYQKYLHTILS